MNFKKFIASSLIALVTSTGISIAPATALAAPNHTPSHNTSYRQYNNHRSDHRYTPHKKHTKLKRVGKGLAIVAILAGIAAAANNSNETYYDGN